jgi:hypothetical protein
MAVTIEFDNGNAAFDAGEGMPWGGPETARILRKLADQLESGGNVSGPIHDVNGNRIGRYSMGAS